MLSCSDLLQRFSQADAVSRPDSIQASTRRQPFPLQSMNMNLHKSLIWQAGFVPLGVMLVPILIAFFVPGYSSVSQHISELAYFDHPAIAVQRFAAATCGISIALFAIGLLLTDPRNFSFTALAAVFTGVSLISSGIFVMPSPLHGLGLGIFMPFAPAFFAAEVRGWRGQHPMISKWSMGFALVMAVYSWSMSMGFLHEYRGITQRMITVIFLGWYSFAAFFLCARIRDASAGHAGINGDLPAR